MNFTGFRRGFVFDVFLALVFFLFPPECVVVDVVVFVFFVDAYIGIFDVDVDVVVVGVVVVFVTRFCDFIYVSSNIFLVV